MLRPTLAARLLVLSLVSLILCACEVSAATCGEGLQEEGEQCEDALCEATPQCQARAARLCGRASSMLRVGMGAYPHVSPRGQPGSVASETHEAWPQAANTKLLKGARP